MWLKSKEELSNTGKLKEKEDEFQDIDVHSTCIFYIDSPNSGELRYFVPRYGRDEDYVTGSVQSTLTPLVAKKIKQILSPGHKDLQSKGRSIQSFQTTW